MKNVHGQSRVENYGLHVEKSNGLMICRAGQCGGAVEGKAKKVTWDLIVEDSECRRRDLRSFY